MKCHCPNSACNAELFISDTQLKGVKKPLFACPGCSTKIFIPPSKAGCGSGCGEVIQYYPWHFEKGNPYTACKKCGTINQLNI